MGLTSSTQTQTCPVHWLIRAVWNGQGRVGRQRTMVPWLRGRLICCHRNRAGTCFPFCWAHRLVPCTVPGRVKGFCWAPMFVRAVDIRWSPGDGDQLLPYFSDYQKRKTWWFHWLEFGNPIFLESHLFGDGGYYFFFYAFLGELFAPSPPHWVKWGTQLQTESTTKK